MGINIETFAAAKAAAKKYTDLAVANSGSAPEAHDLRYYEGKIQYYDDSLSSWVTVSIADLKI